MAASRPRSKDFGAAFAGLVLGGAVLFLMVLTIVWLTNSKFEGHKASTPPAPAAPSAAPSTAPAGH